jgi:hypothetical protein
MLGSGVRILDVAEAAPPAGDESGGLGGASTKQVEAAYVPTDAVLIIAARPADLAKTNTGKQLAKLVNAEPIKLETKLGLPISDLESVTMVASEFHQHVPFTRIIARAAKPYDWSRFAGTVVPNPVIVESPAATRGKSFFRSEPGQSDGTTPAGSSLCYWLPDDRTVVFAPEREMGIVTDATVNSQSEPKWAKAWEWATTRDLAVMIDVDQLRKLVESDVKQGMSGGIEAAIVSTISPIWEDARRLFVVANLADNKVELSALAECPSEEAAGRLEHTSKSLMATIANTLSDARKGGMGSSPDAAARKEVLLRAGDELLKGATVKRKGDSVLVKSEGTVVTTQAVVILVLPAIQAWRDFERRAQGMNR